MCCVLNGSSKMTKSMNEEQAIVIEELHHHPEIHVVWISDESRSASFHAVTGYTKHDYSNHDYFMAYLHSLQERGYRFQ